MTFQLFSSKHLEAQLRKNNLRVLKNVYQRTESKPIVRFTLCDIQILHTSQIADT